MRRRDRVLVVVAWLAFVATAVIHGFSAAADPSSAGHRHIAQTKPATPAPKAPAAKAAASTPKVAKKSPAAEYTPTIRFRLRTELADGKMAFVGVGGGIEGIVNPPLRVAEGDVVQVTLINNDNVEHDVVFPEFDAGTDKVARKGASSVTVFRADRSGEFPYFCSLPGHRQAGMEGKLIVGSGKGPVAALPPP
jgi:nitrite reductase (NO-forming)